MYSYIETNDRFIVNKLSKMMGEKRLCKWAYPKSWTAPWTLDSGLWTLDSGFFSSQNFIFPPEKNLYISPPKKTSIYSPQKNLCISPMKLPLPP